MNQSMELLRCRTRLALLWIIRSIMPILISLLLFFEPGILNELMSGKLGGRELTGGFKVGFGIVCWLPWIMAWAAMTLNVSINRWANVMFGVVGAILFFIQILKDIDGDLTAGLINYIFGFLLHVLIAWYGWKLPEEDK